MESTEVKSEIENYYLTRKHSRERVPIALKIKAITFIEERKKEGKSKYLAAKEIGLSTSLYDSWIRSEKKANQPKLKVFKPVRTENKKIPHELEIICKHPYLGEISLTGDKAISIWKKISDL